MSRYWGIRPRLCRLPSLGWHFPWLLAACGACSCPRKAGRWTWAGSDCDSAGFSGWFIASKKKTLKVLGPDLLRQAVNSSVFHPELRLAPVNLVISDFVALCRLVSILWSFILECANELGPCTSRGPSSKLSRAWQLPGEPAHSLLSLVRPFF